MISPIFCSIGDNLPEFQECVKLCKSYKCQNKKIHSQLTDDFNRHNVIFPLNYLLFWDCASDCDYKCQQIITSIRSHNHQPMVKFHGKWPFVRIFGITELASTVFSLLNFHVNYTNFRNINRQYKRTGNNMYLQYLYLLAMSMVGWIFSTMFHIRDTSYTEILDYYGASFIIFTNFYVILVRYYNLHASKDLYIVQGTFLVAYCLHVLKMTYSWDYSYNMMFHLIIGISGMILWVLHSLKVAKIYSQSYQVLNNSISILPYETKILTKLNFLGVSKSRNIPYLPIFLNLWLILVMGFEIGEFTPWMKLIDSHSLWHLGSWVPQLIWYDWNVWDIEVSRALNK